MGKNIMVAIVLGALAILACVAFACARSRPAPAPSASVGTTPAPCPPGAKYCPVPVVTGPEEIGADTGKVAQLLDPITTRARVYYANGATTRETAVKVAAGVWLVPEGVDPKLEAPAK